MSPDATTGSWYTVNMLFNSGKQTCTYALIYEVGSGSVLLSIIESDPTNHTPTIVWSHREYITTNQTPDLERTAKKLGAALMNVGMLCNSEGMQALQSHNAHARITHCLATLTAPWSYTINKTVHYKGEGVGEFTIDLALIQELATEAAEHTQEELAKHEHLAQDLHIINHRIVSVMANGYEVTELLDKTAQHLTMSHISSLGQAHMTQIINEVHSKTLPKLPLDLHSFMMVLFYVVRGVFPNQSDYCILDVTNEAVELGVVRDKNLTYCSHINGGTNTIAQTINQLTELPHETVMTYLKTPDIEARQSHIPDTKQPLVDKVLLQFQKDLHGLFYEPGDVLITPRTVYLHCDPLLEDFYIEQVQTAICRPLQSTCAVRVITNHTVRGLQWS